jgi:hypothetical protein
MINRYRTTIKSAPDENKGGNPPRGRYTKIEMVPISPTSGMRLKIQGIA